MNDFRRVDAVQTNVRVGVGEDDRVAFDYPRGAGQRARLPVDGKALPAYCLEHLERFGPICGKPTPLRLPGASGRPKKSAPRRPRSAATSGDASYCQMDEQDRGDLQPMIAQLHSGDDARAAAGGSIHDRCKAVFEGLAV